VLSQLPLCKEKINSSVLTRTGDRTMGIISMAHLSFAKFFFGGFTAGPLLSDKAVCFE